MPEVGLCPKGIVDNDFWPAYTFNMPQRSVVELVDSDSQSLIQRSHLGPVHQGAQYRVMGLLWPTCEVNAIVLRLYNRFQKK